jgi:pimeloyl-ACP methyl ester carboxylesterase
VHTLVGPGESGIEDVRHRLALPGGRILGYDDHGPPAGVPILLFHGTPSSRYDWYLFGNRALAERLHVRVIAVDRPGVGVSSFQPGRRIGGWPADVTALADALGLGRFAVLGYSGGGPYVLACARQMPERLIAAGIVSGTGPYDVPGGPPAGINSFLHPLLTVARSSPQVARATLALFGGLARRAPASLVAQTMFVVPEPDRSTLARPEVLHAFVSAFLEALRPGAEGVCLDTALMVSPWGFDLHPVTVPVYLWHGALDRFVLPVTAHYLARALPRARLRLYAGEGHASLLVRHAEELLAELVAGGPVSAPAASAGPSRLGVVGHPTL